MKSHIVTCDTTIYNALQEMDNRKVKFLIVVDNNNNIKGTLTDGDIRRSILKNISLENCVTEAMCKDFTSINSKDGLDAVLTVFKNPRIEFIPVTNDRKELVNIITRRGLQVMLLENERFKADFDFSTIDENTLEHEIFARPWGFYKTTVLNEMFQAKVIYVLPGQKLSVQSHNRREEYWSIANGEGKIYLGTSVHPVMKGSTYFIPKTCIHSIENTSETETLIFTELQLGDYFGEDDIIRYEDIYGRA